MMDRAYAGYLTRTIANVESITIAADLTDGSGIDFAWRGDARSFTSTTDT
jgi:hypothetical protein